VCISNSARRFSPRVVGSALGCALFLTAAASICTALGAGSPSADQVAVSLQKLDATGGCVIAAVPGGARLKAAFQDLEAEATPEGLWITSTADEDGGKKGNRFMLRAEGLGREILEPLQPHGEVEVSENVVSWVRPMIVEEYRVSMDGVRQDFVVRERPKADGEMSVALQLHGARAEAADYGAKLTVQATGRELAYHRLLVTDATGRKLPARMGVESSERLVIRVDDSQAAYPVRIDPTFSDADWISLNTGGIPGVNGSVFAVAMDASGNLYAGGSFDAAGFAVANNIAKWDGSAWTNVGAGIAGTVNALALGENGRMYAGGSFSSAGGVSAASVAVWDGTNWTSLGSGIAGQVGALAADSGNVVYAGGTFTNAGGAAATNIARWDGTNWSGFGAVRGTNLFLGSFVVAALAIDGTGNVYVGGTFTNAGGAAATNIARWDGTNWSGVGSGIPTPTFGPPSRGSVVDALAVSGTGTLYAGGLFTNAGGIVASNIAKWDGSNWSAVGSGLRGPSFPSSPVVSSIALDSNGDLYASGTIYGVGGGAPTFFGVARWDGTNWSGMGDGISSSVQALGATNGIVFATGSFSVAGEVPASGIARWDGASWQALGPSGMNSRAACFLIDASGNLYVGGSFRTLPGGVGASAIAKWNGNAWTNLGSGVSGTVSALASIGNNLYAGGSFTFAGGTTVSNIAQWNGTNWSALGMGMNREVNVLAKDSNGNLYAGGAFTNASGIAATRIARWDGTNWTPLGAGLNRDVESLVVDASGSVYAGGTFTNAGGVAANRIARWNGTNWAPLGSGMNSTVSTLALDGLGNIYAAGSFTNAGGVSANRIARWNGTNWSPLGVGISSSVEVLAVDGRNNLYAGGSFTNAGGAGADRLAVWNGTNWSPLGSGVNGSVGALLVDQGSLYVGGSFSVAGNQWSPFMAAADVSMFSMTALERWRWSWFGTTNDSGNAADGFDFDADGLVNVLEWALGLDPKVPQATPVFGQRNAGAFQINYRRSVPSVDAGTQFLVEWRDNAVEGPWSTSGVSQTVVFDDGNVQDVEALIPADGALQRFGRLRIIGPQ